MSTQSPVPASASQAPPQAAGLPTNFERKDLKAIWLSLLWILAILGGGALAAGVVLVLNGKDASAVWPIVTAVVGGLIGLMAPSPTGQGGG
jgi:hypothetical protein